MEQRGPVLPSCGGLPARYRLCPIAWSARAFIHTGGASYLRAHQEHLASLVAHYSEAQYEAALRGLGLELAQFPRETSAVADALTHCDITTSATGMPVSFQERIADILRRYDEASIVAQAIWQAQPALAQGIERVQRDSPKQE